MAKTIQQRPEIGPPRPQPARRRISTAQRVLVGLIAFSSLFFAVGAVYGFGFYVWADHQFGTLSEGQKKAFDLPCQNGCNYLMLGSDSRAGLSQEQQVLWGSTSTVGGHRSDTIMLVHLDSSRKKAIIVSFPRDLWLDIPNWGWDRLSSAYTGGAGRVAETLHNLTGLNINGFVGVNLAGFQNVVNALGGVPICIERPMFDELTGLNLPHAGCYNLGGFQALAYVRSRHVEGDCIPDFSRIGRQQQFLRAVIAKILRPQAILHAPSLISSVAHNLTVDNVNTAELVHLTRELQGVRTGDADFRAVPGTTGTVESTGQSVVFMTAEARLLFERLKDGKPLGTIGKDLSLTPISPANVKVRVYDQESGGKAGQVDGYLLKAGFDVFATEPATALKNPRAGIFYQVATKNQADRVHDFLPTLPEFQVGKAQLPGIQVGVVIPSTYNGVPFTEPPEGSGSTSGPSC